MARFKDRLKQLRRETELTQQELAKKLGVSFSSISMYERGEREPSFEMLEMIADFFNVDMNYLLGKTDTPHETREVEVFAASSKKETFYDDLPEEAVQELENFKEYLRLKYGKK